MIVDDVISAGTSVRESVALIKAAGGTPAGVVIALDRMERGTGQLSAIEEVRQQFGLPVIAIATLENLLDYLAATPELSMHRAAVAAYREKWGA